MTPQSIAGLVTTETQGQPVVQAGLLAEAIRTVPPDAAVPPGLRVDDLHIDGDLDLSFVDFPYGLEFTNCTFSASLELVEASVGR